MNATVPTGINNAGQIVGWYEVGPSVGQVTAEYGFVYSGGKYTTIDPPGGIGVNPYSINDIGEIVGQYSNAAGTESYGFLATPSLFGGMVAVADPSTAVPEPSTWAMMLIGLAGLGFAGYRSARPKAAFVGA